MKKTDIVPIDKNITERDELQRRINETTTMLYEVGAVVRDKAGEIKSLKQSLEIFIQDHKKHLPGIDFYSSEIIIGCSFDASRLDASQRERYDEILSKLDIVEKELSDAKKRQDDLQNQETSLLSNIATMDSNYATECLLYLQQKHNEAERTVCMITGAITVQQNIIDREKSDSQPVISSATQIREEILANVALGTVDESESAAIDEQLRKTADTASESAGKMNEAITIAQQTITGLQRKLATAQDALDIVKFAKAGAEKRFLLTEAEIVGREYMDAANVLTGKFRRLLALNTILENKKIPSIENGDIQRTFIPLFSLECHKDLGEREFDAIDKASRFADIGTDMQSEFERFTKAGIIL